ncbi:choline-sulfatase [Abditibacteriota bacterium]|nr:choline-sulfatase [Abditibacteriota bacterium]
MPRPNIVWLNADHYAFHPHFSLNRDLINTPAFDRLGREGVVFDNAYTICPLCTPARASLATGQYPHRHGILNNEGAHGSRSAFKPDAPLIAYELQSRGYRAALFGKWHAVGEGPTTASDCGYEGWSPPNYGWVYGTAAYASYLSELGLEHPNVNIEWHLKKPAMVGKRPIRDTSQGLALHPTCGVIEGPPETHESYFLAHLATRYLSERAQDGEPFCMRLDTWGPHQPYHVAPPFANTVDPAAIVPLPNFEQTWETRPLHQKHCLDGILQGTQTHTWNDWAPIVARCYEHISLVDHAFGRVLNALDELGLSQNTLVFYSADHGDLLAAHGGGFDKGWLLVEETTRIPLVARGVGGARGARSQALVSNLDIVATIRDVTGAQPSNGAKTDGETLTLLLQNPELSGRDALLIESHGHYGEKVVQRMVRWAGWKFVAHLGDRYELYDLKRDPYELENQAQTPEYAPILALGCEQLLRLMEQSDDESADALTLRAQIQSTLKDSP